LQKTKAKEEARTQQLQKERNNLNSRCEELERKVATHEA
jgi:uncharacterized protein YlxW (UPF0749 family)